MPETLTLPKAPQGPKVRETRVFTKRTAALYRRTGDLVMATGDPVTKYQTAGEWGEHWTDTRAGLVLNCYLRIEDKKHSSAEVDVMLGDRLVFHATVSKRAVEGGLEITQAVRVYDPGDWEKKLLKLRPRRKKEARP